MNWLHYLLEANLYLAVFYAGYYLFLRRETYYTLNRIYLLFSCIASFALPVMQLGILKPIERPVTAVHFTYVIPSATFIPVRTAPTAPVLTWQDGMVYIYLFGAAVLLVVLLVKLYQLLRLTRVKNPGADGSYKVVHINESDTAFSFFNYLFIGTKVQQAEMIIKHELVHIRQKHSADIIFIEILKIINWFNPFIYLLQYSLREIHEYIADEKIATSGTDALAYSSFLVSNAYGLSGSSITHSFFNYNLLKKRIIMLHQKRSGSLARLRYLLAIPICAGLLCASTLAFSKTYGIVDLIPQKVNTPQKPRYDVWNKSYDHTFTTSIGYKVRERVIFVDGAVSKTAEIIDKNGQKHFYDDKTISPGDRKFANEKYGYQFPIDTVTNVKPLPPPPPPAPAVKQVKFPPPMIRTPKGYLYTEAGYMENGKQDMTVTIHEKNGSHKKFTKSKATPAEIALLKDKYGYVFPAHLPPPVIQADTKLPPPPPTVRQVRFPPPIVRLSTSKGYPYSEAGHMENGKSDIKVTIYEKDGSHKVFTKSKTTTAEIALLKDKYGYEFPAHLPPPPPPEPPKPHTVKFAPPVIRPDTKTPPSPPVVVPDGKTPPPPPPAPPTVYTKKGYKYKEDGYVVDGKTDFRVTVFEKNGNQVSFFKSKASDENLKLLNDKYGYTFPNMNIYTKMPPPPPAAPESSTSANSVQINRNEAPDNFTLNGVTFTRNRPSNYKAEQQLIIVNGVKYYMIGNMASKLLRFSDTDSTIVYKDNKAVKEFGPDGQKGAYCLFGTVKLAVLNHGSATN